jgi:hypothetical protein
VSTPASNSHPPDPARFDPEPLDIAAVDAAYRGALRAGVSGDLPVVGYGEISLAFGWPPSAPTMVIKSLPDFDDHASFEAYVRLLEDYVAALVRRGVDVVPTTVRSVGTPRGRRAYVIQPLLPAPSIGPAVLARADEATGGALLGRVVDAVMRASDATVGLDGQLSNWAVDGDHLRLLDVSTPMLRDDRGQDRLDTRPFVRALPWVTRGAVHRFVAPGLLAPYHDPRAVILDTAGNLIRERLTRWIPVLLERANPRLTDPLTVTEVVRFYRANARLWASLQALRRADRAWQRRVRGRTYPFLLPERYRR